MILAKNAPDAGKKLEEYQRNNPCEEKERAEWRVVSHEKLFNNIRENIGTRLDSVDLKSLSLMNDFMIGICPPQEDGCIAKDIVEFVQDGARKGYISRLQTLCKTGNLEGEEEELLEEYAKKRNRYRARQEKILDGFIAWMTKSQNWLKEDDPETQLVLVKYQGQAAGAKSLYASAHFKHNGKDGLPAPEGTDKIADVEASFDGRTWYILAFCRNESNRIDKRAKQAVAKVLFGDSEGYLVADQKNAFDPESFDPESGRIQYGKVSMEDGKTQEGFEKVGELITKCIKELQRDDSRPEGLVRKLIEEPVSRAAEE